MVVKLISRLEPLFLSSSSSFILTRAEWTPFQTHCYLENLVAPGIESGATNNIPDTHLYHWYPFQFVDTSMKYWGPKLGPQPPSSITGNC
jgi:hypothetical protein